MTVYTIKIEGMGCEHCVNAVRAALEGAGANDIAVEIGSASAAFGGDAALLQNAIEDTGFDVVSMDALQ